MSLIPYHPREDGELVLRHQNSLVYRNPDSLRLEIYPRECPTCHQPLDRASSSSEDRHYDLDGEYVDPTYFRKLRAGTEATISQEGVPSPVRRLFPALAGSGSGSGSGSEAQPVDSDAYFGDEVDDSVFGAGSRIRSEAFSPNYFKTFFVEETVLGKGGKGVVLLVRHEIDGCQLGHFACKRVPVGDDHGWLEKVLIEVELLAALSHPNLVSYRHVWLENVQLTRFGPSVACAFILQQYCNGGDLHQYVVGGAPREATKEELKAQMRRRSKGQAEPPRDLAQGQLQLSFEDIFSFFRDITLGVSYLHANNYIHRDLKPSNCLLHSEGGKLRCLISDFGEVQPKDTVRKSTGSTGTISYCAPEVLKMDVEGRYGNFTTKSDMFSLGMILYFMCFGRLPYQGANAIQEELEDMEQLRAEIADWKGFQDERRERPDLPTRLYQLLKKLLALNPAERPSANEVLTAMKSETNFGGISRVDRSSPTSASGLRRVQNLDSPAAPGTPVPVAGDARKERAWSRFADSWSEPDEGTDRAPSLERETTSQSVAQSGVSQRRGHGLQPLAAEDGHSRPLSASVSTPLLMAPPRSSIGEARYQMQMAAHRILHTLRTERVLTSFATRLAFFLLKLGTLARPCWPLMASPQVSIPLVVVAALDLGLSAADSPVAEQRRRRVSHGSLPPLDFFSTEAVTSLTLLAVHFVGLWLARRWGALCVAPLPNDDWV
ncbi:calcium-dependent protein kinase [Ophiocordyceps camponoti-floridani]|uniref:non-specific serine/threonine protein kinase n=1 Tax=Ophiocordyceps camponoti-floridani TaxID=2030778 RepID=A0A8H4VG51_9HYPO|nr:calcium-dependent protein kinase [Ophiocordyceps camponoti-floridani]